MAGFFYDPQLENRKRVLVTESEIYRQTLKLECFNLRLYSVKLNQKLSALKPALLVAAPLVSALLQFRRERPRRRRGILGKLLLGWGLYRRYGGLLRIVLGARGRLFRDLLKATLRSRPAV